VGTSGSDGMGAPFRLAPFSDVAGGSSSAVPVFPLDEGAASAPRLNTSIQPRSTLARSN
jgi:hypothetical protein